MKSVFQEKLEFAKAKFNTKHGLMIWLVESMIFGYLLVNYTPQLFSYFNDLISISNETLRSYLAYLLYGLVLTPLGLTTTFLLNKLFNMFFKNMKVIK